MNKRVIIVSLLLLLLIQGVAQATTTRMRVLGGNGLDGIVADEATDIQLNPAQLYLIEEDKLFLDSDIFLVSRSDWSRKITSISPTAVYQLNQENVMGIDLGWERNSFTEDDEKTRDNLMTAQVANAMKVNEALIAGGRVGVQRYSNLYETEDLETDYSDREFVLAGGFIYQLDQEVTIDGSLGWNTYGAVNSDHNKVNLFLRRVQKQGQDQSLVGLMDFNFDDGASRKRIAVGQNTMYEDIFLAYSAEWLNQGDETTIGLHWGAEKEVNERFTVRAGNYGSYVIFERDNNKNNFSVPRINGINLGVEYQYDDLTTIDLAYLPNATLGFGDNSTKELDLEVSITRKF
ncbi:hypothetical protein MWH25_06075 [Natroniella acetigena]|uniref:hypothetical protein n=1 Tax=Natroniella acetigena TaxID=52004 RepID=UPI00200B6620|nr:hypothetical protein [Natroniella acetigena]MCK8827308.1 hypothetical protein [Natroniella acetigena]